MIEQCPFAHFCRTVITSASKNGNRLARGTNRTAADNFVDPSGSSLSTGIVNSPRTELPTGPYTLSDASVFPCAVNPSSTTKQYVRSPQPRSSIPAGGPPHPPA